MNCLGSAEQGVYELVLSGGEMIQQKIVAEFDLTKIKVNRAINRLSYKELVRNYRQGYSNRIGIY